MSFFMQICHDSQVFVSVRVCFIALVVFLPYFALFYFEVLCVHLFSVSTGT